MSNTQIKEQINDRVNIFLGNDSVKNDILSGASPQEKYIILINDTLQAENKQYFERIKELENQVEDLEGDIERMEKGKACLKGMLNNFNEMNKLSKQIVKIEKEMRCDTVDYINQNKKTFHELLRIAEVVFFSIILITYYFNINTTYFITPLAILCFFNLEANITTIQPPPFPDKEARLKELAKEMIEASKAQDYIHELIESH